MERNLTAFRLSEERAAARYLAARRDLVRAATRAASVRQLAAERPERADYRAAVDDAVRTHSAAMRRTFSAWERWQQAQRRSDGFWTCNQGAEVAA
jgi:hypothetical protein